MDAESENDFLGEDLRVTTALLIGPSSKPPTDPLLAQRLIESLDLFDDGQPRAVASHEEEATPEIQRLERKLDLVLYLVAESLHPQRPSPVEATLSVRGLALPADTLPADCERVEVYLSRLLPQPCVFGVETPTRVGARQLTRWTGLDDALADAIGRWIFRLHRREVAGKRQKVDADHK